MNNASITCPYCQKQFCLPMQSAKNRPVICPNCLRDLTLTTSETTESRCQFCGDPVSKYACRCGSCGEFLKGDTVTAPVIEEILCPFCSEPVNKDANRCGMCGEILRSDNFGKNFPEPQNQSSPSSGIDLWILIFCSIFAVFIFIAAIASFTSIAPIKLAKDATQSSKKINPELEKKLGAFTESGHELLAAWEIGLSYIEFTGHLVKIKARWDMISGQLPDAHEGKQKMKKASAAWVIAYTIWGDSIEQKNTGIYRSEKFYIFKDFLADEVYSGTSESSWHYKEQKTVLQDVMKYANDSFRAGCTLLKD